MATLMAEEHDRGYSPTLQAGWNNADRLDQCIYHNIQCKYNTSTIIYRLLKNKCIYIYTYISENSQIIHTYIYIYIYTG